MKPTRSRPLPDSAKTTLSSPLAIRGVRFRNRIFGTAVGFTRSLDSAYTPTERMIAMYRRRAQGGAALVTIEATFVEDYRPSKTGLPGFYSDSQIPQYSTLVDAIHSAGAKASIQIFDRWHSDVPYDMRDFSPAQIESMIDTYVRAAVRIRAAGFDAVNFQMAHGWPLSRFASPLANHRIDKYGDYTFVGSEVLRRTRAAVGNDLILIPRFNILEDRFQKRGVTLRQAADQLAPAFEEAGADILDLSFGLGPIVRDSKDYTWQEHLYDPPKDKFNYFKAIKEVVGVPVLGRGANDAAIARDAIEGGFMDILGIGRQLLADPDFPNKTLNGEDESVDHCLRFAYCMRSTLTNIPLRCAVNPSFGREIEASYPPLAKHKKKTVFVVGGGAAGMQAAVTLDASGCDVVLFETASKLGGLVLDVVRLPKIRLTDLQYAIDDLLEKMKRSRVQVRLDAEFQQEIAISEKPDCVILATGSAPVQMTGILGSSIVVTFRDYLRGAKLGRRVLVDGHGEGAEFAVSLAREGHAVTLVEEASELKPTPYDYGLKRVFALVDYMAEEKVHVHWRSHLASVDGKIAHIQRRNGPVTKLKVDTVLVAGRAPLRPKTDGLLGLGIPVIEIGDCLSPRGLGEALVEGRDVNAILV